MHRISSGVALVTPFHGLSPEPEAALVERACPCCPGKCSGSRSAEKRHPLGAAGSGQATGPGEKVTTLPSDPDENGIRVLTPGQVEEFLIEEKLLKDLAGKKNGSSRRGQGNCPVSYTMRFLMEVLRLYPPVWITCRKTMSSVVLGDHPIPEGTAARTPALSSVHICCIGTRNGIRTRIASTAFHSAAPG